MTSISKNERIALLLIILVGAWLRFHNLGAIEYNLDQAYTVWQALNTLDTGALPLTGQGTSVLFANPPLTGYSFIPLMALSRHFVIALVAVLILNTFAIYLAFRGLCGLIGTRPALVSAALFAVNPWVIEDSRRTWVQSLMPFFVCLIFWALVPVLTRQTRHPERRLLIALISLTLFANTYLLAYALTAPVALLLLIFWKHIPKRQLFIGVGIFTLAFGFYALGLYRQRADTERRYQEFSQNESHLTRDGLDHAVRLVTGWEYEVARGKNAPADDWELRHTLSTPLHWLWLAALVAGFGRVVIEILPKKWRKIPPLLSLRDISPFAKGSEKTTTPTDSPSLLAGKGLGDGVNRDTAIIFLVWFIFPLLLMTRVSNQVNVFYLMLALPVGHGLAGLGVAPLLKHRIGTGFIVGALVITSGVYGVNSIRFGQESARFPTEHYPTLNVQEWAQLGQHINEVRDSDTVFYSPIDEWGVMVAAGDILPVVRTFYTDSVMIPQDGGLIARLEKPNERYQSFLYAEPTLAPMRMADGTQFTFWTVQQDFPIPHATQITSDIGVTYLGWEIRGKIEAGQIVEVLTYWRIDDLSPATYEWTFIPYLHLFDASGERIYNTQGEFISPIFWHRGDWMIQRMVVPIPTDRQVPYHWNTGLFDSNRLVNGIFHIPNADGSTNFTADIPLDE